MPGKEWLKKLKACKKDRAAILLLTGVLLLILAVPSESGDADGSILSLFGQMGADDDSEPQTGDTAGSDSVAVSGSAEEDSGQNISGTSFQNVPDALSDASAQSTEEAVLEARLAGILSQVEGVGKVQVMITLKSSGRKEVEKDVGQSSDGEDSRQENGTSSSYQSSDSESTVFQKESDGSETPYVTEAWAPEIQGVLVIAQGAGSPSVVSEITEAVEALFGTEAHKIKVMKME